MMLAVQGLVLLMVVIGCAIILLTKNVVHAAYALGLSLVGIAGLYVFLNMELLAVVQILLYAGGVVILLAFGVMMTNRLQGEQVVTGSRSPFWSLVIALATFVGLVSLFSGLEFTNQQVNIESQAKPSQLEAIGVAFLTDHLVAFELIAFVLLVALVGAAYMAKIASDD
ncbi:MAG: NADH-quinone oxidoreductase subunit J [Bacteroidota bacterium]